MLSSTFILAIFLAISSLVLAAPTSMHVLKIRQAAENTPWKLKNMTLFTADEGTVGISKFSFIFHDTNPGLELVTSCNRTMAAGSGRSAVDGDNYYPCANSTVKWKLGPNGALDVKRTYIDNRVGAYPWWFVTASGSTTANFVNATVQLGGINQTASKVRVRVTTMVS